MLVKATTKKEICADGQVEKKRQWLNGENIRTARKGGKDTGVGYRTGISTMRSQEYHSELKNDNSIQLPKKEKREKE